MERLSWGRCCAVVVLAVGCLPSLVVGQEAAVEADPFGGNAAAESNASLDAVLEPTLANNSAINPGPADEATALLNAADDPGQDFCRCVGDTIAPTVVKIQEALRNPLKSAGLDFVDTPLEHVVAVLQDEYGIPIKLDTAALDDLGLGVDEPVTVNLRGISLRAALRLMLKKLGLTYIIQDEVLLITTPDEAEQQLKTCVYDVRDLKDVIKSGGFKKLVDTIVSCVSTETWAENGGGEAEVRPLEPGLLVVSQTQAVHEQVRDLLETIRQMSARPAEAGAAPGIGSMQAVESNGADKVVTRSYMLAINQPTDAEKLAHQIRDLIIKLLPDEQWVGQLDDGQPVVLAVLPDRIVLRHREAVQKEVQTLLTESGIASPAAGFGGEMGGGFGGAMEGGGGGFFNPDPASRE